MSAATTVAVLLVVLLTSHSSWAALSEEFKNEWLEQCNILTDDDTQRCQTALDQLDVACPNGNFTPVFETLGFVVPSHTTGDISSQFWSSYATADIMFIVEAMSTMDNSLWSSFNILPGAITNNLGPKYQACDSTTGDFWDQYSVWMALNTEGNAFWLSGSSADSIFPYVEHPNTWERKELPNLNKGKPVETLTVIHLPIKSSTGPTCQNDTVLLKHLQEVHSDLTYYCCELLYYGDYSMNATTAAAAVIDAANGMIRFLEGLFIIFSCLMGLAFPLPLPIPFSFSSLCFLWLFFLYVCLIHYVLPQMEAVYQ